ncbi:MAG: hypothetical protein ABL933_06425 [Methyloglobulus sp.]|nr:hypothetical protein [Methyloglobulus sp.]
MKVDSKAEISSENDGEVVFGDATGNAGTYNFVHINIAKPNHGRVTLVNHRINFDKSH